MPICQQCGREFTHWLGEGKHLCPECETSGHAPPAPEILPPQSSESSPQPAMELPAPLVTRILIGINVAAFVAMVAVTRTFMGFSVLDSITWGANWGPLTANGQWWRMLTATFLHGGLLHLAVNMWALRNLGYTAELFYRRRNYVVIYLLSGLAGSAASLLRGGPPSVGASGAIFGVAGALASLVYFKKLPVDRALLRKDIGSIGMVIFINLLIGARVPQIDNVAHFGGLIAGAVLGLFLPAAIFRAEREKPGGTGNLAIAGVVIAIIAVSMWARQLVLPQAFEANYSLGRAYIETGHPRQALPYLTEALRLRPDDVDAQQALSEAKSRSAK